eukprot:jgi/Bigna1/66883/fgenesh1_pg.2_\
MGPRRWSLFTCAEILPLFVLLFLLSRLPGKLNPANVTLQRSVQPKAFAHKPLRVWRRGGEQRLGVDGRRGVLFSKRAESTRICAQGDAMEEDQTSIWEDESIPDWLKIEKGMLVRTFGLKNESFNGLEGLVMSDIKDGRFPVTLWTIRLTVTRNLKQRAKTGEEVKARIKPFNLEIVEEELMYLEALQQSIGTVDEFARDLLRMVLVGHGRNAEWIRLNASADALASLSNCEVSTIAGTGKAGHKDGPANETLMALPHGLMTLFKGIAYDDDGSLLIADTYNDCIRVLSPSGEMTTLVGNPDEDPGLADGTGTDVRFYMPLGIARHPSGDFIVTDGYNQALRRIRRSTRKVTTVGYIERDKENRWAAGGPFKGQLMGVSVSSNGAVFMTDAQVDQIMTVGRVERNISQEELKEMKWNKTAPPPDLAILSFSGEGSSGSRDGDFEYARFAQPEGIIFDEENDVLLVSDYHGHRIRQVDMEGDVITVAGMNAEEQYAARGHVDGPVTSARFHHPHALAFDKWRNLIVAEDYHVRIISPDGNVQTLAGEGPNDKPRDGPGLLSRFQRVYDIAMAPNGDLAVTDTFNNKIRFIHRNLDANGNPQPFSDDA